VSVGFALVLTAVASVDVLRGLPQDRTCRTPVSPGLLARLSIHRRSGAPDAPG